MDQDENVAPEIPVHPFVPIYHLMRHGPYEIHVSNLEEYIFDQDLGDNLVLPEITKNLADVLVSQGRVAFQDIIEGKGGGACILLGGPPCVGKTLTAEVFDEATERPLLSVQAAQLGIAADKIEESLAHILNLGNRWNAVVLLDEADVYISERGDDGVLRQVVAAFLRVLENHTSTVFLTTNRIGMVDDAIASRCLARPEPTERRGFDRRRDRRHRGEAPRPVGPGHQAGVEAVLAVGAEQGGEGGRDDGGVRPHLPAHRNRVRQGRAIVRSVRRIPVS